jgi:hypothetical protein
MPKCQKAKCKYNANIDEFEVLSKTEISVNSTKSHRKYFTPRKVVAKRVRNSVANYSSVYVLTFKGIKPNKMKEICQGWKQSKFICENKTYVAEGLCSPQTNERNLLMIYAK